MSRAAVLSPLAIGVLVLVEFGLLRAASYGRFYPALPSAENGAALLWAQSATKALALGFVFILAMTVLRPGRSAPRIVAEARRRGLVALNFAAFAGGLIALALIPADVAVDARLGPGRIAAYLAAIASVGAVVLTGTTLIAPRALSPLRFAAFCLLAVLGAGMALGYLEWALSGARALVEGTTLDLSLWLYSLTGREMPMVDRSLADPVISKPGFAVVMAPTCSGYQGMIGSVLVLGAYAALERRRLRLPRVVPLCLLAVAATFGLNAVRIATLFLIGETVSPEVAVNGFHSQFGTLSLLTTSGLAILAMEAPVFQTGGARGRRALPAFDPGPAAVLMLPLALFLVAGMVSGLFTGAVAWLYPVPVAVGAVTLWAVRGPVRAVLDRAPDLWAIPVGVGVYALWMALVPADAARGDRMAEALAAAPIGLAAGWIVVRLIGTTVVVPVVEELAFRGGLFRLVETAAAPMLGPAARDAAALVLTSVAFGLLHGDILAATLAGLAYGALYLRRRALLDAVVAHGTTNFLISLHVLGGGQWSYW